MSGGADSMVLAFLLKQLAHDTAIPSLDLTAFIVDHQARANSAEEALTVSGWLNGFGEAKC